MFAFITCYAGILIIKMRFQKGPQYEETLGMLLKKITYPFIPKISQGIDPGSLKQWQCCSFLREGA